MFQDKPVSQEKLQKVTQMVALYSYEASTPEDLDFAQGDVITILSKGKKLELTKNSKIKNHQSEMKFFFYLILM